MSDEKYIKSLFDAARNEQPELSFEEASKTFENALKPGISETVKDWLFNRISLNSFITITALGIILSAAFWGGDPDPKPTTATNFTTEITETQTIENDSLSPIKVTVETENETVEISLKGDPTDIRVEKIEKIVEPENQKSNEVELTKIEISDVPVFDTVYDVASLDLDEPSEIKKDIKVVSIDDLKKKNQKAVKDAVKQSKKVHSYAGSELEQQRIRTSGHKMSELEKVIGISLNMESLDPVFTKNGSIYKQLTMITNDVFDHRIEVRYRGKQVIIAPQSYPGGLRVLDDFIDVKELKIKDNRSYFKFFYGKNIVEVILVKREGIWYFERSEIDRERDEVSIEEHLVQKALDVEYLKEVFKKDSSGNYLPLVIFTNGYFSKGVDVYFDEKRVPVFFNETQSKQSIESPVIKVTKFKRKRRKIDFEFDYGSAKISIEMKRKKDGKWHLKSIHHKEPGKIYSNVNF